MENIKKNLILIIYCPFSMRPKSALKQLVWLIIWTNGFTRGINRNGPVYIGSPQRGSQLSRRQKPRPRNHRIHPRVAAWGPSQYHKLAHASPRRRTITPHRNQKEGQRLLKSPTEELAHRRRIRKSEDTDEQLRDEIQQREDGAQQIRDVYLGETEFRGGGEEKPWWKARVAPKRKYGAE